MNQFIIEDLSKVRFLQELTSFGFLLQMYQLHVVTIVKLKTAFIFLIDYFSKSGTVVSSGPKVGEKKDQD